MGFFRRIWDLWELWVVDPAAVRGGYTPNQIGRGVPPAGKPIIPPPPPPKVVGRLVVEIKVRPVVGERCKRKSRPAPPPPRETARPPGREEE